MKGPGRSRSPKGSKKRKKKSSSRRGPVRRFFAAVGRLALTATVGVALGGSAVLAALFHQAEADVEARLAGPVWSQAGAVHSGPLELWRGLKLTPEELARDLSAAGYARVKDPTRPGDFAVGGNDVYINVPAKKIPGYAIPATEVHVAFSKGRVRAVSPSKRVRLGPVELAGLRGPDNEARHPVSVEGLPEHVLKAVLAMEDSRFFDHEGLDPIGIGRAMVSNMLSDGPMQGGSTLTQQLVKNLFLTSERTYARKGREALLALALEQSHTKDEILELYLNEVYFGQASGAAVCGIDQAARVFFGKPAARLELGEAATLGGIVSAPNRYSPLKHPDRARERRDITLRRMLDTGAISQVQFEAAKKAPLEVHPAVGHRRAPWFVDAAVETVEAKVGEGAVAARGLDVHTTLHPVLQRLAEQAVAEGAAELDKAFPKARGAEIALVAVRVRDGAVVAMVGGRSYGQSQFNRTTHGRRQLGSTIKPFTFLAALDGDATLSPVTIVEDAPLTRTVSGKTWTPKNYDGTYRGDVTYRDALAASRNIPAVLVAEQVGMARLQRFWKGLGLEAASSLPSASLGAFGATPLEVATAYTVFPGGGRAAPAHLVRGVIDEEGRDRWPSPSPPSSHASERATYLATRMLERVVTNGTGRKATTYGLNEGVGGKTGTTDGARDAWFAGFTDELAVAVWVGFDKGKNLGLTGSKAALPTWSRFVSYSGTAGPEFRPPESVVAMEFCPDDHLPAGKPVSCEGAYTEYVSASATPSVPKRRADGTVVEEEDGLLGRTWDRITGDDPAEPAPEPAEPSGRKRWWRRSGG